MSPELDHRRVLADAVTAVGGVRRSGQEEMADRVAQSLAEGSHLLVQAGTGTGKSLGYLAPSLLWAIDNDELVIVSTATLALQNQLATRDIPVVARVVTELTGRAPRAQIVKGRANYACLLKAREEVAEQASLFDSGELASSIKGSGADGQSVLGAEVLALREWIENQAEAGESGDRDDAPSHSAQAWAQVSSSARQCIGASRCSFGDECFTERARMQARQADLVITNHALLAINAMTDGQTLPEYGALIIDEAHELTNRVSAAASADLQPVMVRRAAAWAANWLDDDLAVEFDEAADSLAEALAEAELTQLTAEDHPVIAAAALIAAVARRCSSELNSADAPSPSAELVQAQMAVKEIFDTATRVAKLASHDVVWVSVTGFGAAEGDKQVNIAPLSVAGLLRENVLGQATTVLTSATLTPGGNFDAIAASVGLAGADRLADDAEPDGDFQWRGIDVGSPFNYAKQGILYIATGLRPPGREGLAADALAELKELVDASQGDTLGLFTSQRAAEAAAKYLREELPGLTVLCQGDDLLPELTRRFLGEQGSCLLGTLSLWQGIDIPGDACRLVVMDKLPFPRPDDPLLQARQQAVSRAGGNGFMQVAASHAALLLAQGSGRLIRRNTDRGVVAVLDPRLETQRYGNFLKRSIPPFWRTTDRAVVLAALRRLAG